MDWRPLDPQYFAAAGHLLVAAYPHRRHEPAWWLRTGDQTERWGLFDDADSVCPRLLAYAALWRVEERKFRFDVIVRPADRRLGHGHRLLELVRGQAGRAGARTLQARACAEDAESLTFLAHRQFVETMRMRGFVLPMEGIECASLLAAAQACSVPDVSIQVVSPEECSDSQFWGRLAVLHDAARHGWPDPDPGGPMQPTDPAILRRMLMPSEGSPIAFMTASQGERLVGYSLLSRRLDSGEAQFASTAVDPSMRGLKIATTLRARCILAARQAGFPAVRSASGSAALIRINARFGFRETYSEVRLVRAPTA